VRLASFRDLFACSNAFSFLAAVRKASGSSLTVKALQKTASKKGVDPVAAGQLADERRVAVARGTDFAAVGTYDIWGDAAALPQPVKQVVDKKRRGAAPSLATETKSARVRAAIPTLLAPMAAESVNPKMDDVLDVSAVTALQYERDEAAAQFATRAVQAIVKNQHAALIAETQEAIDAILAADDDDADDDAESSSLSEETVAAVEKARQKTEPKKPVRPSDMKRKIEVAKQIKWAKEAAAEKRQFADFDASAIEAELAAETAAKEARAKRRRVAADKFALANAAGAGRNKFEEADAHVVLPRRVAHNAGRLVRVAATPYAVRDMMKSLQRRGKMESQRLAKRNNARVTYNVK
jgi:hypothetical protein